MSSSVFIEPGTEQNGKEDKKQNPDLVVVYGKSGVNIDPKDLETLIEEKAVKTISVIRISSPTPSMEEAEEAARLEAAKDAQEEKGDSDEATDPEAVDSKKRDAADDNNDSSSKDSEEDNSSVAEPNVESKNESSSEDEPKTVGYPRRSRKVRRNALKNKKSLTKKQETKQGHEVMGLTLEGFYEAEAAIEIAKEACKMAGIPYVQNAAEYEFTLFVIRNDHCYTPFTSPEQMKTKLAAEKLEPEKMVTNLRKGQNQLNIPSKQIITKSRKLPISQGIVCNPLTKLIARKTVDESKLRVAKEKLQQDDKYDDQRKSINNLEEEDDEEEAYELIDVEDSDYTGSEQSVESDNDRDSDLDFSVNNRQTKKRRIPLAQKKMRRAMHAKMQDKRNQPVNNQDERLIGGNTPTVATTILPSTSNTSVQRQQLVKTKALSNNLTISSKQIRQAQVTPMNKVQTGITAGTTVAKKTIPEKVFGKPVTTTIPLQQGQILYKGDKQIVTTSRSNIAKIQSASQPAVKEIVINKVLSSPKGCFTELTTLISEAEKSANQTTNTIQSQPTTPTSSMTRNPTTTSTGAVTPSRTGFMRIDASAKNSLPSQISVETHQSSSELLAEHDKQLDLIDSIVKDELNKSLENISEQPSISTDENIPKLVQMLESTEKALGTNTLVSDTVSQTNSHEQCINTSTNSDNPNSNVDDIDISHDLPEDLLQHVVELIEDDKTLQEAVEKEILEQEKHFNNETLSNEIQQQHSKSTCSGQSNSRTTQSMQHTASSGSSQIMHTVLPATTSSKSIIQMAISNTNSSPGSTTSNSNLTRSSPIARRDPIQIIRGNGRVITLPPIEAPTTRAKRRAQVVPSGSGVINADTSLLGLNESSLDGSLHSNASFSAIQTSATATTPSITATSATEIVSPTVEKKSKETLVKRRTSKEGSTATAYKTKKNVSNRSKRNLPNSSKQDDAEASESQGDDDDPKKLWCICRQPHNNRFMICCDACGDWFHGTCVNVTKAMGREMEQKGIEWSCPQCSKKKEDHKQRKLTDMLEVRRSNSTVDKPISTSAETIQDTSKPIIQKEMAENRKSTSGLPIIVQTPTSKKTPIVLQGQRKIATTTPGVGVQNKSKVLPTTSARGVASKANIVGKSQTQNARAGNVVAPISTVPVTPTMPCVLCKKAARPNTAYCSDDCIRRSAQNAINAYTAKSTEQNETMANSSNSLDDRKKKAKGLFEDLLSMADFKPKVERIVVYDRKSGTKLSGSNAPTTLTIKKWLHDNPSFEVVLPGSQISMELEKHQHQRTQVTPKQVGHVRTSNLKITPGTPIKHNMPSSPVNQNQISSSTPGETCGAQTALSPLPVKVVKQIMDDRKHTSGSASPTRPSTPRQLQKYPQHVQIKPDNKSPRSDGKDDSKSKERQLKRQNSDANSGGSSNKKSTESSSTQSTTTNYDSEPIRMNVRRTLKEQIIQRMNESGSTSAIGASDQTPLSSQQLKLTPEEVDIFVKETEAEMFNMFRDTGAKYKAKYRSLMFNIKDRKNHTLFAKICAKQIKPKQLVHMSPEELASQELAQWRENENKHQLEMIKKSELDLLSCTKNYLFKNHKGEEVIESKDSNVCVNLDMAIPVEDVVNVLNNSTVSSNNETEDDTTEVSGSDSGLKQHVLSPLPSIGNIETHEHHTSHPQEHHHHYQVEDSSEKSVEEKLKSNRSDLDRERERGQERESGHDRRYRSRSHDSEKDPQKDRHHRSKSKESEKDRDRGRDKRHRSREHHHRDKSRSRRRSHSRSKSRSRSEEKRLKRESTSSSHKERERKKERDNDKDRERKEKKVTDNKQHVAKTSQILQVQSKDKHRNSPTTIGPAKHKPGIQQQKSVECFSLIDQIIESSKTVEEAANLVKEPNKEKVKEKLKEQQSPIIATSSTSQDTTTSGKTTESVAQLSSTADSDQEPSSTVSIPTPPHDPYSGEEEPIFSRSGSPSSDATQIWSGGISMNEVASLQMRLHHLIGNSHHIGRYLPENLDVVGRIDGETVWEYLWKIRRSPNKEIILLRLLPYSDDDTESYAKLFQYLDQKKRLGVIKSIAPQIKDFYIYPLENGKQLPKVLQVTNHDDFYNDPYRPDMIIGIIVRVLGKRIPISAASNVSNTIPTVSKVSRRNRNESESFTPPGSPKRRKHNYKTDLDIDAIIKAPIVAKPSRKPLIGTDADEPYSPGGSSDDDMPLYSGKSSSLLLGLPNADDDLKRKMEEINRQIAAQEMEIAGLLNVEPTSSASVLANISIPSNLPQILASIKNKDNPVRSVAPIQPDRMPHGTLDEYNPEDAICSPYSTGGTRHSVNPSSSTSRLAQLSEAELLRMVPDDMLDPIPSTSSKKHTTLTNVSPYYQEPPPPGV